MRANHSWEYRMDLGLKGEHVLITGGSQGIGFACAQAFVAQGARVSLVARNTETLAKARGQLMSEGASADQVHTESADMRDANAALQALDRAEAQFGPVQVLVNSAGAAQRVPVDDLTPQAWHDAMQAKFFSYVHMTDPCIKRMGQRGKGNIVNIIGNGGKVASPIHLAGGAANAALMLATTGWANAYARRGVRVNGINPGQTLTERLQGRMQALAQQENITPAQASERSSAALPMGRFSEPHEIANMAVFLCAAQSSYVTGAMVSMDGALTPVI
jgi:NAD(P)-dependent dehydrogenase (short-subunit alcohol dehydrogenase family)